MLSILGLAGVTEPPADVDLYIPFLVVDYQLLVFVEMGGEATSAWSSGRQKTKVKTNNTVPCCQVILF